MPDEVKALADKLMSTFWDEFDSFDGECLITKDGKTEGFEALARVALAHVEERRKGKLKPAVNFRFESTKKE